VCSDVSQQCEAPAGAGDLCQAGEPDCEPGFFCAGADENSDQPGNCRTYEEVFSAGLGEACSFQEGTLCQTNLACVIEIDAVTGMVGGTCAAKVGSGQACGLAIPSQCPDSEYCTGTVTMLEGTCMPKPEAGEACVPGLGDDFVCAVGTRCDGGTCRPLAQLGQSCIEDAVCLSERCVGGSCVSDSACE
jgi:hypothetical protein